MGTEHSDAKAARRYEARIDGDLAGYVDYRSMGRRIALIHTEVLPSYRGRGVADDLVRYVLADARVRDLRVIAICPFVRAYLERHPEEREVGAG